MDSLLTLLTPYNILWLIGVVLFIYALFEPTEGKVV